MPWTKNPPEQNGYYLWRISFPGEPPAVGPFLVYPSPGPEPTLSVQELSPSREQSQRGRWDLREWVQSNSSDGVEYFFIGDLETGWRLVRAFRELYTAAVTVWNMLNWSPDLSREEMAVFNRLTAAIEDIHREE